MKILALTLISTLVSSRTFHDTKTILAQMENQQFGQGMLSLIQANMHVGNPVEQMFDVFTTIVNQVEKEQDMADKKNSTNQGICMQNTKQYFDVISNLNTSIENSEILINENEAIQKMSQETLSLAKEDYQEVLTQIQEGTDQRTQEHAVWMERDEQANVDVVTLEEGVRLIQHMLHGVSFVEISLRYNKVLAQLSSSSQATLYKPLVSQLTQLTSKLNFDNVQKVLNLLENMRKQLVQEKVVDSQQEELAQKDWETLLADLNRQKQSLEVKIEKHEKVLESSTELLKTTRKSLANNQASLENNQGLLSQQQKQCTEWTAEYLTESEERDRQVEVLNQLLEHIVKSSQAVHDYLNDREANSL